MVNGFTPPVFGTTIGQIPKPEGEEIISPKQQCKLDGGVWDEATQTCLFAPKDEAAKKPPEVLPNIPEVFDIEGTAKQGVTTTEGRQFFGLSPDEIELLARQQAEKTAPIPGTAPAGTTQRQADIQFRGQQLAGGIGQFQPLGVSPTGLKLGEALTTGAVNAIPQAIQFAGGAAVLGAATGTAVAGPLGTVGGAAIGAAAGFVAGLVSSMVSNFKSQRADTTTAQQRILDEGKQTMKDWATLARNDPANKAFYLAEYNKQSAQIDQAYRQMKLDTSRDVAKFETALPNLAEFESFYSSGGERDTLNIEMRTALLAQSPPNYDMLELTFRRKPEE